MDESKAGDLLSLFHLKNSKMSVQGGLGSYSETNAPLLPIRKQSSREVKGFSQGFIHDRAGNKSGSTFLNSSLGSLWYLQCGVDSRAGLPGSNLGQHC